MKFWNCCGFGLLNQTAGLGQYMFLARHYMESLASLSNQLSSDLESYPERRGKGCIDFVQVAR